MPPEESTASLPTWLRASLSDLSRYHRTILSQMTSQLAPHSIEVPIEPMWVWRQHRKTAHAHIPAIQVPNQRTWRNTDTRIRGVAVVCRRSRWRRDDNNLRRSERCRHRCWWHWFRRRGWLIRNWNIDRAATGRPQSSTVRLRVLLCGSEHVLVLHVRWVGTGVRVSLRDKLEVQHTIAIFVGQPDVTKQSTVTVSTAHVAFEICPAVSTTYLLQCECSGLRTEAHDGTVGVNGLRRVDTDQTYGEVSIVRVNPYGIAVDDAQDLGTFTKLGSLCRVWNACGCRWRWFSCGGRRHTGRRRRDRRNWREGRSQLRQFSSSSGRSS